jgi:hypothetical protein
MAAVTKVTLKKIAAARPVDNKLPESTLKIFDVPFDLLVGDDLNPNEMSEDKFDLLVQNIEENGFDEPVIVIPHPRENGKYLIASGHHRVKAARQAGLSAVPVVIKSSWSEDQQKISLVARNIIHGKINSEKFSKLYTELAKKYDAALLQTMLGFTQKKEFEALYDGAEKSLAPAQRKKLAAAKEKIKSVDDLSKVLHDIFKQEGTEASSSYVAFSYGGKKHHYIQLPTADSEVALSRLVESWMNTYGSENVGKKFAELIEKAAPAPTVKKVQKKIVKR